jgi:plastocyanin
MNDLDSRELTIADCYEQRFTRPGVYLYDVRAAGVAGSAPAYPFAVEVRDSPQEAIKHEVVVRVGGERLIVTPATVTIGVGDLVLWYSPEQGRPFVVDGEAPFFGNDRLRSHCGYSHAFALPGDYEWADANGSGLHGIVRVTDPRIICDEDRRQWFRRLRKSLLVMIRETRAEPPEVTIETGQRVRFAVLSSPGVTVTDVRLLA